MIEDWTEMRTALYVARLGTVSAAADALGLHRATVLRHIDLLEKSLGEKLFLRHGQGYTATEAGQEMMLAAHTVEERFSLLEARIRARAQAQSGDIVLTSMPVVGPRLLRAVLEFNQTHPDVKVRHIATHRSLKLERGEAHVAVRAAPLREEPDNVVEPFAEFTMGLFASAAYLQRRGAPQAAADLADHSFVAPEAVDPAPVAQRYLDWLADYASEDQIAFRTTDLAVLDAAVEAGVGLGFMPLCIAQERRDLVRVLPDAISKRGELYIVTHVDLHRAPRIQDFIKALKAASDVAE